MLPTFPADTILARLDVAATDAHANVPAATGHELRVIWRHTVCAAFGRSGAFAAREAQAIGIEVGASSVTRCAAAAESNRRVMIHHGLFLDWELPPIGMHTFSLSSGATLVQSDPEILEPGAAYPRSHAAERWRMPSIQSHSGTCITLLVRSDHLHPVYTLGTASSVLAGNKETLVPRRNVA